MGQRESIKSMGIPTGMRVHGTHPREKYKRCKQKSTKTRSAASQPFMFHYQVLGCLGGVLAAGGCYKRLQTVSDAKLTAKSVADDNKWCNQFQNAKICRFRVPRSWRHSLSR